MRPVVLQIGVTMDAFPHGAKGLGLVEARTFPSGTVIHVYRPHEVAR